MLVELLLQAGADPRAVNRRGESALSLAEKTRPSRSRRDPGGEHPNAGHPASRRGERRCRTALSASALRHCCLPPNPPCVWSQATLPFRSAGMPFGTRSAAAAGRRPALSDERVFFASSAQFQRNCAGDSAALERRLLLCTPGRPRVA